MTAPPVKISSSFFYYIDINSDTQLLIIMRRACIIGA